MKFQMQIFSLLLMSFVLFSTNRIVAQVVNDGVSLSVTSGTDIYIDQLDFQNQTNTTDGSIDNDGTIHLNRNWINNATGGVVFVNLDVLGNVIFEANIPQNIGGTRTTTFENLMINNTSLTGVTLNQFASVDNAFLQMVMFLQMLRIY